LAGPQVSSKQSDDHALMAALLHSDVRDQSPQAERSTAERSAAEALSKLYDRHAGLVYTLCSRILHDRSAAEETLIDIFHELYRRAERYDPSRSAPLTYIMTLARSRAIDRQRTMKSRPAVGLDETMMATLTATNPADDPKQRTEVDEQRQLVRDALGRLDLAHRQVIELSYFDGLSHSEIAEKLAKPLGTVKTYIRTGLIRLRESMRSNEFSRGKV
jgi:RNA polymerase sigma-70 factor, ECF subfamily